MTTVALGVFMFTTVIVTLVVVLMLARRELVATGDVDININDDPEKSLTTSAGGDASEHALRKSHLHPVGLRR